VTPDIVLLILDTQRVDRLSCYGYPLETTPHLDELAADATLFRHAVSTAQWTIPSHTSMFTGLYPSAHTMLHAFSVLPATLVPLAQRLRDGGYFTAAFCNNPLLGVVNNGLQRGFTSFLNYGGLMASRPNQTGDHQRFFDRYRRHFKRVVASALNGMQDAFARSDHLLDFSFSPIMVPLWQTVLRFKGNAAKSLNDAAHLLINRQGVGEDHPIFSFINLMETHMPYHPPERYLSRFASHVQHDKDARRFLNRFNGDVFGWLAPLSANLAEKYKAALDGVYDAEVAYEDELVGAFLQKLRASGRLDRTLLIVCADHGEHLGEKQMMGHSFSLYNELVHVPLLIRDPDGDLARGKVRENVVSTRRIFHTILTAAGLATGAERGLTLAQSADSDPDRNIVFAEGVTPQNALTLLEKHRPELVRAGNCDKVRRAIWQEHKKLIQVGEDYEDLLELYDVVADPYEKENLRDVLPEQVRSMHASLRAFVRHVGVSTPEPEFTTDSEDDEQVYRRLRDLGYLE